ncbi:MAG: class I SAM-dependent methyltransferase [Candidatus Aenigmatarchaeota archaeon]
MKNAFGDEIPEIKDILQEPEIAECVKDTLARVVLKHLEIADARIDRVAEKIFSFATSYQNLSEYESNVRKLLSEEGVVMAKIPFKLTYRAEIIFNQIKDFVEGSRVADVGCGDGRIGELVSRKLGKSVELSDTYEHDHVKSTDLAFKLIPESSKLPYPDDSFDTALLLVVLHHSNAPFTTLRETIRITRPNGVIVVIESVFAPKPTDRSDPAIKRAEPFLKLSPEQHRKANMFLDHFYNRCIHYSDEPEKKVSVPFNFKTPEGWKELFEKEGLVQERVIHLGIDRPSVPEYHTLHVLRVKK